MRKSLTALGILLILSTLLVAVGAAASCGIDVERISLSLSVPDPIVIAHVSDLHSPRPYDADGTVRLLQAEKPDCIVLTGDVLDGEATDDDADALSAFFSGIAALCPCLLVIGNHEIGSERLPRFLSVARAAGVRVLLNESLTLTIRGSRVAFLGLSDGYPYKKETFSSLPDGTEDVRILLTHRPEKLPVYANPVDLPKPDLVFAGHAHGGIARLGKLSLYAPDQGLFPRYTSGVYRENGTVMVVSRGLGVSGVDFRWFNRYHLPVVTIS